MTCDLCGSDGNPLKQYPQAHICDVCGFLHVPERRSSAVIAAAWAEIYAKKLYDPTWAGVRARLFYVSEWIDQKIGLEGKSVLDIGAGDGFFLEQCRLRGAHVVGLEPFSGNVAKIRARDMHCFKSAVSERDFGQYDIVTINWTLENCGDCLEMLGFARKHAPNVFVATGSRILVPFRKPLSAYFGTAPPDLHCFRWSANSLLRAAFKAGFGFAMTNDFEQNDVLLMRFWGKSDQDAEGEDPQKIQRFFDDWERLWP